MLLRQWKRCPDYLWILASVGPHHSYFKLRCHESECSYNNTSRWWETRMLLITHGAPALIWQQPRCGWFLNYHAPGEAQAQLWHHDPERINNRWRNRSQVWFEYSTWNKNKKKCLKWKLRKQQHSEDVSGWLIWQPSCRPRHQLTFWQQTWRLNEGRQQCICCRSVSSHIRAANVSPCWTRLHQTGSLTCATMGICTMNGNWWMGWFFWSIPSPKCI